MGTTCPICGSERRSRDGVRSHLHVHHRKFEILDALLDEVDPPRSNREEATLQA